MKKAIEIVVTMEVSYIVPMHDTNHTEINGWTVEEVARDWFERDINSHHATRDSHRLGNGKRIIGWRVEGDSPRKGLR